jgi:hypothetical protein
MLYTNNKPLADGWSIGTQVPVDDRLIFTTEASAQDLGVNSTRAFRYYKGMKILVLQDNSEYFWLPSPTGLLPASFTYPAGHTVAGVDYGGVAYNFVSATVISSDFLALSGLAEIYNKPILYPVIDIVDGNAAPPTNAHQDIYIIADFGNGTVHPDWNGAYNSWAISVFGTYASTIPVVGATCYNTATAETLVYKNTWQNILDGGEF